MDAIELIRAERERQKAVEGWTQQHDDQHKEGQLAQAAACYAASGLSRVFVVDADRIELEGPLDTLGHEVESAIDEADAWPWHVDWDKRNKHDREKQLVIAGALIVAELDRLKRNGEGRLIDINELRAISDSLNPKPKDPSFEDSVQKVFLTGIRNYEKRAKDYAKMGRRRVGILEYQSRDSISLNDLSGEIREGAKRLMDSFEQKGFKVYWHWHGPYVDGGPSKFYYGIDLVVEW